MIESKEMPRFSRTGEGSNYRAAYTIPTDTLDRADWKLVVVHQMKSTQPKTISTLDSGRTARNIPAWIGSERTRQFRSEQNSEWAEGIADHIASIESGYVILEQPNDSRVNEDAFVRQALPDTVLAKLHPFPNDTA